MIWITPCITVILADVNRTLEHELSQSRRQQISINMIIEFDHPMT